MLWTHRDHPGRCVRLAYCLNVHAAETLRELQAGLASITLPLRDRLARADEHFGVGLYLSGALVRELPAGSRGIRELAEFLARERLDAFTFNAFPFGGFAADGLKERVFEPTWARPERLEYTREVARLAAELDPSRGPTRHVSISTHTGGFGAAFAHREREYWAGLGAVANELDLLEQATGTRFVLSLEAEPGANAGDTSALARFFRRWSEELLDDEHGLGRELTRRVFERCIGVCLDACHSAVEFESPPLVLELVRRAGVLGKLQYTSALALPAPARDPRAVARLLALDEPRYLHQVRGRLGARTLGARDLAELGRALREPESAREWLDCEEWRCHFHVPVDRAEFGPGLATTRAHAEELLGLLLADPARWDTPELHVEIETYTWDVLPGSSRASGALVDGLEREYRHVMGELEAAGWTRPG